MKRGWVWVALLLSVGVNIGVLATIGVSRMRSQSRWERTQGEPRQPPYERLANHLGLEGEGRDQFMQVQQRLFRITRQNQRTLQGLQGELRREIMGENPDSAKVDELLNRIGDIHRDLARELTESVLATRELLSPEQQRRYFRVLERMKDARRFGSREGSPPRRPDRRPPSPDRR